MPTFYGPPSDGTVIPEQLETALAADIAAPESAIGGAVLDAVVAAQGAYYLYGDTEPAQTSYTHADGTVYPVVWVAPGSTTATEIAAVAPTFNDETDTYTIPAVTGVEYLVDGSVVAAGTYGVTAPATISVTARALPGYVLTGAAEWTGSFTAAPAPDAYREAVLADSPFYYFPLSDAVGATTIAEDGSSAATFTASSTGITFGQAGIGDAETAADFVGTSAVVTGPIQNVANGISYPTPPTTITLEGIIRVNNANSDIMGTAGNSLLMNIAEGKLRGWLGNTAGNYIDGSTTLTLGETYHVAFTWDGSTMRLYVNGVLDAELARTGSGINGGTAFKIGYTGARTPDGRYAGLAVYKTTLSPARILAHAQAAGVA